ncbi:MAG: GMC family oxidoreductase, partial [Chitinophagaceae bacterium]|nr:GMC family oxidoreductase [Chitinophagaceae bacterium]
LLNSRSNRFPEGLGNDSGVLGKYVAFHHYGGTVSGRYEGPLDKFRTDGRNPAGCYIPRFRNVYRQETDYLRGYAAGFSADRGFYSDTDTIGAALKDNLMNRKLGSWHVGSHMMGETIPKEQSYIRLDTEKKDDWGVPLLKISVDFDDNDSKMLDDYFEQMSEMFTAAGFKDVKTSKRPGAPGLDIHEMGGVRMGHDPRTAMLNKWHQLHACKNVFVTDGACMTSTSTQNPSLTYMAFSARAANFAVEEMKKGNI